MLKCNTEAEVHYYILTFAREPYKVYLQIVDLSQDTSQISFC